MTSKNEYFLELELKRKPVIKKSLILYRYVFSYYKIKKYIKG